MHVKAIAGTDCLTPTQQHSQLLLACSCTCIWQGCLLLAAVSALGQHTLHLCAQLLAVYQLGQLHGRHCDECVVLCVCYAPAEMRVPAEALEKP